MLLKVAKVLSFISTSYHRMFKREIWDKFTEFTFLVPVLPGDFKIS